jgi:hypothetical protein
MKQNIKAALLSALIYPGAGHFALKKTLIGCIFAGVFSVLLIFTLQDVYAMAQCIANDISAGRVATSFDAILAAVKQPPAHCAVLGQHKYLYLMLVIWFLSVLDAYRLGSKKPC